MTTLSPASQMRNTLGSFATPSSCGFCGVKSHQLSLFVSLSHFNNTANVHLFSFECAHVVKSSLPIVGQISRQWRWLLHISHSILCDVWVSHASMMFSMTLLVVRKALRRWLVISQLLYLPIKERLSLFRWIRPIYLFLRGGRCFVSGMGKHLHLISTGPFT